MGITFIELDTYSPHPSLSLTRKTMSFTLKTRVKYMGVRSGILEKVVHYIVEEPEGLFVTNEMWNHLLMRSAERDIEELL